MVKQVVCKTNVINILACCPSISTISGGNVSATSDGITTTAMFTCADGYRLIGEELLTCRSDGVWDFEQPHCCKIFCHDLHEVLFSTFGISFECFLLV